eukprot:3839068-Pleurochrysis_carterae.AAC.1
MKQGLCATRPGGCLAELGLGKRVEQGACTTTDSRSSAAVWDGVRSEGREPGDRYRWYVGGYVETLTHARTHADRRAREGKAHAPKMAMEEPTMPRVEIGVLKAITCARVTKVGS